MYAVAMVKFLAAIGIKKFPVFTLITEGSIGVVTCAPTDRVTLQGGMAVCQPTFCHTASAHHFGQQA
jgi:hypothetical protein